MSDWVDSAEVRIGRLGALPDVVYIAGISAAVSQSLEWFRNWLGSVEILAESRVGDERLVQIRLSRELSAGSALML